ncbi:MAG TPA: methyltransferase domain-containing protein [Terriglobales bacterium]|nr:methyltransferase domain-containing protein [Terriglobales bacterium]
MRQLKGDRRKRNVSVATHLGIDLAEYDARIRTFIPHYEEMLDVAASVIDPQSRGIVDLGIGTGALSARCLQRAPRAKILGIDADSEIVKAASRRIPGVEVISRSFLRAEIPRCDAVVASFALHHVRTRGAKLSLYRQIARGLPRAGSIVNVDCQPARDKRIARTQFEAWKAHLMRFYTETEAQNYLAAWSREDVYVPLEIEIDLMQRAGFAVEVLWRKDAFAVLCGKRN